MRRSRGTLASAFVVLCGCGGGGGDGRTTTGMSDSGLTTATDSESGGTDTSGTGGTGTGGSGTAGTAGTDTDGGCPAVQVCQNGTCCPDGQICDQGQCVTDCGGEPACGAAQVCCAGGEICYAGSCVVPGDDCSGFACATKSEGSCADDQVCEPTLGKCVPKSANEQCVYVPPPAVFDPVPRFSWGERKVRMCTVDADCQTAETCVAGTCTPSWTHVNIAADDLPEYKQVSSLPVVADLDGDCVPEIVFNSYQNSTYTSDGVLRAIRGDDGSKVWTVSDMAYRTNATSNPAVGDITGDGRPDVITQGTGASVLVAVDHAGTPLWTTPVVNQGISSGSAVIVNLDGEGLPEIVFGSAVFDAQGQLLWEGALGTGRNGQGPISCVADLDEDGRPELVGGKTAYAFTGTVAGNDLAGGTLWDTAFADGYCGIADFTGSGTPEVVLVSGGIVRLLDGLSGSEIANIAIPGGGQGGAPNIADFDADGMPEIGTAGGTNYVVLDFNGTDTLSVAWAAPTEDDSSSRTGSSVFDFDGDGRSEVVYNDEEYLRIYPGVEPDCLVMGPGCDGVMNDTEILFRDFNSSRTRTEYPVIADVDGDFKAEIVFSTNNEANFLDPAFIFDAGIEVWEDRLDNWMPTRPVWNQHTYHITNVEDDGRIPVSEPVSWDVPVGDPYNAYRRNTQGEVDFCAPDLVPIDLQGDFMECPNLSLSVWVKNQGCLGVGAGVDVAFYEETLGLLGVVQTTQALVPGAAERVSLEYPLAEVGTWNVWVVVDDDGAGQGALNECDEANNQSDPIQVCKQVG